MDASKLDYSDNMFDTVINCHSFEEIYMIRGLREAIITRDMVKDIISNMVEKGFRIEPNLLTRVLREIERA